MTLFMSVGFTFHFSVEDHSDKLSDSRDTSSCDNTCSRCHHVLKLGDDSIHWIDTEEGFFTCLDHVSKVCLLLCNV